MRQLTDHAFKEKLGLMISNLIPAFALVDEWRFEVLRVGRHGSALADLFDDLLHLGYGGFLAAKRPEECR